jgi:benzodiazapine receptor
MSTTITTGAERRRGSMQAGTLLVSLAAVSLVALVGRGWTDTSTGSWYDGLSKPSWTPPGPVFGIVWTILYLMMAIAAWLVARQGLSRPEVRRALVVYTIQLALNLGWTATFFAAQRPGWAIVEIAALFVSVVVTMILFRPISTTAFWMMVPYAAWVLYATSLTIGIATLN